MASYNEEKALRVADTLDKYASEISGDREAAFIDILTDLQHAAEMYGVDFDDALDTAEGHFSVEQLASNGHFAP